MSTHLAYREHRRSLNHLSHQLEDPADYQSIYELDNAHRAFEPFDYDAVDIALAAAEGRDLLADDEEDDCFASREEQYSLLAFVYYMLDKADYRTRLDVAIAGLGWPFGNRGTIAGLALGNQMSRQTFHGRVTAFRQTFEHTRRSHEALVRFIAILINSKNYRLRLEVAIASFNIPARQGETFTSRAKRFKISKQAFTKHVLRFQKDFRLPPTREQKSLQARASYRMAAAGRQAVALTMQKN